MTVKDSDKSHYRRRRGGLTIARIAQLAGVSAPTVSRVLNGRAGVGLDTRARIEALLREHGYRRAPRTTTTPTLEVVFYALESHLAIEIMRGVEAVARDNQLAAAFSEVRPYTGGAPFWVDRLHVRRPTGVITVHSRFTAAQHAKLAASGIPLVALDPTGEPVHGTPAVGAANWSGGIAAGRHLLELGHRRIAVISGPPDHLGARARLEGCRAVLEAAGLPLEARLVRTGPLVFEDGLRLGRELIGLADPPTAIVCGNDLQALGVYEAARQAAVAIPRDLSVIGFDDIQYTRWCGPPMTSVLQPFEEMGQAAARMAIALARGETLAQTRIELATTLIVRESTAPPRR